ncbi:dd-gdca protein [Anaeramoeba flamelloides]|uniref:Dd-gdca protein n=1 Tax=Anaeramoeba flamelloides TaxID=1746091 RepID=A0AAV7YR45_9EUKA|nr:dd-gdca protein [Anaeramoeba flamelloides]
MLLFVRLKNKKENKILVASQLISEEIEPELSCSNKKYVSLGQACNSTQGIYCYANLFCLNNVCTKENTGASCTQDSDCYGGLCTKNNVCTSKKDCGDSCQTGTECWSGQCHSNVCSGLAKGLPCDPSQYSGRQCDKGLYCDAKTNQCESALDDGVECYSHIQPNFVDIGVVCIASSVCDLDANNPTEGVCVKKFSVQLAQDCKSSDVCALGLACQGGKCVASPTSCNEDQGNYCPYGSQCLCKTSSEFGLALPDSPEADEGTCNEPINYDCTREVSYLMDCVEIHGCQEETHNVKGTCVYDNCFDLLEEYQCCLTQDGHVSSYYVLSDMECNRCNIHETYNGIGGVCEPNNNKFCYDNLWCNENTGKCEEDNTGSDCNDGTECYGGICISGKCSTQKYNGDICTADSECISGNCDSNLCRGKAEGATCDTYKVGGEDCDLRLFCDSVTSTCIKSLQPGEECTQHLLPFFMDWTSACTPGYVCEGKKFSDNGTCKLVYGGGEGSECDSSYTCQLDLACQDGLCTKPTDNKCDYQGTFCPYGHYCQCNDKSTSGTCQELTNQDCKEEADYLISCAVMYNCPLTEKFEKGTCLYLSCFDYIRKWQCCLQDGHEDTYFTNNGISCKTCPDVRTFHKLGESCDSSNDVECYENLWCNSKLKICQADNTGSKCNESLECYGGICANNICSMEKEVGDECQIDEECWSGNCNTERGECDGIGFNKACDPSLNYGHNCGKGLYCDYQSKLCLAQKKINEDCWSPIEPNYMELTVVCASGLICDYNVQKDSGQCRLMWSGVEGSDCSSSRVCEMGLACQNNKCTKTFSECDENTQACPVGYNCICSGDQLNGKCNQFANTDCQVYGSIVVQCLEQYNCGSEKFFAKGTCAYENCFEEIEYLECCKQSGFENSYYLNTGFNCKKCNQINKYVGLGSQCTTANTFCYQNLWCNSKSKVCEMDNTGETCTSGTECFGGVCSNGKCSVMKANGDDCTSDVECLSGTCLGNTTCHGLSPNANCDPSKLGGHQCDIGLFCDSVTRTCISQIKAGEDCIEHLIPYFADWGSACTAGYICDAGDNDFTTGTCKQLFSGMEGDPCDSSIICESGLACQSNKCTKSFEKCNFKGLNCPEGYYCECGSNQEDGTCKQTANTDCQIYQEELVDCIDVKGCSLDISIAEGTCIYEHCFEASQRLECCKSGNGYQNQYFPNKGMECHNCVKNNYGGVGDECDLAHEKLCMKNLYCNSNLKKCKKDNTGSSCTKGSDCSGGVCANKVCAVMKSVGDQCAIDQECWNTNCQNNVCSGFSVGTTCDPSKLGGNQCDVGLFCDSKTKECIPQISGNFNCMSHLAPYYQDYENVCEPGYVCDPDDLNFDTGTCRKLYSGVKGDSCGNSITCQLGYSCVMNKCNPSKDVCNDKTHLCPQTHYCNCNSNQTEGTCTQISNDDCQEKAENYVNCLILNQCNYPEQIGKGQCNFDYCLEELIQFECCSQNGYDDSYFLHSGVNCNRCPFVQTYSKLGEKCDLSNENFCYDNLWCNEKTGKCEKDNTGEKCTSGTDCYSGICANNKCIIKKYNGVTCSLNEECWNNNCKSGVCTGKAINVDCDPSDSYGSECDEGLFCDSITAKCIEQLQSGSECYSHILPYFTDFSLVCQGGYYCENTDSSKSIGYCKRLFSGIEGEACGKSHTCQLGLSCQDNKCSKENSKCDLLTNNCPWGSYCECSSTNTLEGTCHQHANMECQYEVEMLVDCLESNECPYEKRMAKGTCGFSKCYDELQEFECCLQENNYENFYYPHSGVDCNTCSKHYKYAEIDEDCNPFQDEHCLDNLWCDFNDYKCKKDNTGDKCSYGIDCYGGICSNSICTGKKMNGEKCTENKECFSKNCVDKNCKGLSEGAQCDPVDYDGGECDKGLFCDSVTEKCIKQIQPNEECYSHLNPYFVEINSVCTSGYICENIDETKTIGYCKKMYSGIEGDSCGTSKSCQMPFACQNFQCVSHYYTCDQTTRFCPDGSYCYCSYNEISGACVANANMDCQTQAQDLTTCIINNNCGHASSFVPGTCIYDNCFNEQSKLECCKGSDFYDNTYFLNKNIKCEYTPTPTPSPSSPYTPTPSSGSDKIPNNTNNNVKLGVGVGIPLSIALIAVAFFMWPKKNKPKRKGKYQEL